MDAEIPDHGDVRENESEESLQRHRSSAIARLRRYLARQSDLLGHYAGSDPESRRAMVQVEQDIEQTLAELDQLHEKLHKVRSRSGRSQAWSFMVEARIPESRRKSPEYLELMLLRHCASDHTDIAHYDPEEANRILEQLVDDDLLRRIWKVTPSSDGGFDGSESITRTEAGTERLHELERMLTAA